MASRDRTSEPCFGRVHRTTDGGCSRQVTHYLIPRSLSGAVQSQPRTRYLLRTLYISFFDQYYFQATFWVLRRRAVSVLSRHCGTISSSTVYKTRWIEGWYGQTKSWRRCAMISLPTPHYTHLFHRYSAPKVSPFKNYPMSSTSICRRQTL